MFIILSALILTGCSTASNISDSIKEKTKTLGKNPCYDEATKTVKVGCKKN